MDGCIHKNTYYQYKMIITFQLTFYEFGTLMENYSNELKNTCDDIKERCYLFIFFGTVS